MLIVFYFLVQPLISTDQIISKSASSFAYLPAKHTDRMDVF